MTINRHNYESYFLDYLEGNLSVELQAELMVFLEANSDLKAELEMMREADSVMVSEEHLSFDFKHQLKKIKLFTDDELISVIEKDASTELINKISIAAENDKNLAKEISLFEKTILLNEVVVYSNKEDLKRRATVIPLFYNVVAIAASLLLIFLVERNYFSNTKNERSLAQINTNDSIKKDSPVIISNSVTNENPLVADRTSNKKTKSKAINLKQEIIPLLAVVVEENKIPEIIVTSEQPSLAQTKPEIIKEEKVVAPLAIHAESPVLATNKSIEKFDNPTDYLLEKTIGVKPQHEFKEKWLNRLQYAAVIYQKATGNKAQVKKGENDCGIRYDIAFGKMEFSKTIACK